MKQIGSIIAGEHRVNESAEKIEVRNPYNQELLSTIHSSSLEDLEAAIDNAHDVYMETMRSMPAHQRSKILQTAARLLEERNEQFAKTISEEAGKPIVEARGEVTRALQVLQLASGEAKNLNGEQIAMDSAIGGEKQLGIVKRIPLGVVAAITPFNFPLNLALHKIAPAIAIGNTVVLKPAEKTPISSVLLHDLLLDAGLPPGAVNIVNGYGIDLVKPLVTHPKVKKVTFTGSDKVGWHVKDLAKEKPVTLELGSNAPNIIFNDANLENAAAAITMGGFTFAGQACVSAQRVFVHKEIYEEFVSLLTEKIESLKIGDPADETTQLGPMITEDAATRAENWIQEAVRQGATLRTGGERNGPFLVPAILENVKPNMNVVCMEVFAPMIAIIPFEDEQRAIEEANESEYGLQAGVFTNDINRAFRIADQLEMGGVWINEVSVRRYDHFPYGGVKQSGIGKEGVRYAIEGMSDLKFIGVKLL
ncbi:aldehyde dehydrogenase family protein [Sporosarcina sp. ACRSL]|uniref:aldehyde dehydrogenase family protein n=1 Tax=Sporosarcina sp. ACRSL TaxID=2918215 RepID=UPI001EF55BCD|nr:aldehyde dehydrogenase family protein [Sporosarcina sp. ACRSL]MCG7344798.1 aldehyde dehydrogenase family protein [Sporosarcina sp. ACRSL]